MDTDLKSMKINQSYLYFFPKILIVECNTTIYIRHLTGVVYFPPRHITEPFICPLHYKLNIEKF